MKPISSRVLATGFVAAMTLASTLPAGAAPMRVLDVGDFSTNIVKVQAGGGDNSFADRRGFERRGGVAYYNGHRGYRDRHDGYRRHNGYWFPPAAFLAGALIGGAIVSSAPPPPGPNPHVDWCITHYRSYNPYDNTFQPHYGPRLLCRSPYGG